MKSQRAILLAALLLLGLVKIVSDDALDTSTSRKLTRHVMEFDNDAKLLILTLLRIAAMNGLPMGIERVTPEALSKPVSIKLSQGSVAELLDRSVATLPDFHWTVSRGTVFIFGEQELRDEGNPYASSEKHLFVYAAIRRGKSYCEHTSAPVATRCKASA